MVYALPARVLQVLTGPEQRALEQRFDMRSPIRTLLARVAFQPAPSGAPAAGRQPVHILTDLPVGLSDTTGLSADCIR